MKPTPIVWATCTVICLRKAALGPGLYIVVDSISAALECMGMSIRLSSECLPILFKVASVRACLHLHGTGLHGDIRALSA